MRNNNSDSLSISRLWRIVCILLMATVLAGAQGFGNDKNQTPLNDSLLKFSLYGKEWVDIGYQASTATGGLVGTDTLRLKQDAVVGGDVYVYDLVDSMPGTNYQKFLGKVLVGHDFLLKNSGKEFGDSIYVSGLLQLGGDNLLKANVYAGAINLLGAHNRFYDETHLSGANIQNVSSVSHPDTFGTSKILITNNPIVDNVTGAEIFLNEGWVFPDGMTPKSYAVPATTVDYSSNSCTVSQQVWWTPSMCNSSSGAGKKTLLTDGVTQVDVLPPGKYGDFDMKWKSKVMLGEGVYEFKSFKTAECSVFVDQPNRGRTQILVDGDIFFGFNSLLRPKDTTGLKGGTILMYQGGTGVFTFAMNMDIFATVIAPNAKVHFNQGSKLFGQVLAKQIDTDNYFSADDGLYIPFSPANPTVTVSENTRSIDEGNSGTSKFPITFTLNYVNGRDVTVNFRLLHATTNAEDLTATMNSTISVKIPAGQTTVTYNAILVNGDKVSEANETFTVNIESVNNADRGQEYTSLTILNDDGKLIDTTAVIDENTTAVMTLACGNDCKDEVTYSIAGGTDKSLFSINPSSGVLSFVAAPNFEKANDANLDSVYEVRIVALVGDAQAVQWTILVSVNDVVEPSVVVITAAETKDSSWSYPDTVFVNSSQIHVFWTKDGVKDAAWDSVTLGKVNVIIKTWKGVQSDTPGSDTLVVIASKKNPVLEFEVSGKEIDTLPDNTVGEVKDSKDTLYYTNDPKNGVKVNVTFVGKDLKSYDTLITLSPTLKEGANNVCYTATDIFGNSASGCVGVVLDTKAPVVNITDPEDLYKTLKAVEAIAWTVDGVAMDTLLLQSLALGTNTVVRSYQDLAGNVGSDTISIHLREQDDISLDVEKDLVTTTPESIKDYYKENPLRKDEQFTVSIVNHSTGLEDETAYGKATSSSSAIGTDGEVVSKETSTHLGPTLVVTLTLPLMGGVDAAGNNRAGSMLVLQDEAGLIAVTAGAGTDRVLVSVDDYVADYCLEDAFDGVPKDSLLYASLFRSSVALSFMIYDATGHFVDQLKVTQDITNPDYLDDNGQVTMFLELKPTLDGLASSTGRLLGTGVYIVQGQVNSKSVRLCDMPTGKKGEVLGNSNDLLEKFGIQRKN